MRIIHVLLGTANPNTLNGVNKVVFNLLTEQKKLGHDVTLCALSNKKAVNYTKEYDVKIFPVNKAKFLLDKELVLFLNEIPKGAVVHFHSVFIPSFYYMTKILIKRNIRYIITPHGQYYPNSLKKNWLLKKIYIKMFEKSILDNAYKIHAIGRSEIFAIKEITKNRQIYFLPNGCSIATNNSIPKRISKKKFIFTNLCRMSIKQKGLDLLIKAYKLFLDKTDKSQSELWLIGDGEDKNSLESLAITLGISDNIIFYGKKFGEEKDSLLKDSDCFISPSRWEGFPTSVLEAASFNLPIIISEETNMGDYIRNYKCGEVCSLEIEEIAEKMARMFFNIESYNDSRLIIEKELNWCNISAKHIAKYKG